MKRLTASSDVDDRLPEMLAALKAAEPFLFRGVDRGPAVQDWSHAVTLVNAAIMKATGIALICLCFAACGMTKGGSPTSPGAVVGAQNGGDGKLSVSSLAGTPVWTGLQYPEPGCDPKVCGESGPVSMRFLADPTDAIDVLLEYGAMNGRTYRGRGTGTLDHIVITIDAIDNPDGTLCGYEASARMVGKYRIEGEFIGKGSGANCINKRGRFWLQVDASALPVNCMDVVIDAHSYHDHFTFTLTTDQPVTISYTAFEKVAYPADFPQAFRDMVVQTFTGAGPHEMWLAPSAFERWEHDGWCGVYDKQDLTSPGTYEAWLPYFLAGDSFDESRFAPSTLRWQRDGWW